MLHVQGVKHKKRYIVSIFRLSFGHYDLSSRMDIDFQESRYPERKKRVTNKNEMAEWLSQMVKDIIVIEGKGKLKHALVVVGKSLDLSRSQIPDCLV